MGNYVKPDQLGRALKILFSSRYTIIAGATDFFPSQGDQPIDGDILDISAIETLRGIHTQTDRFRINALTTWTGIIESSLPPFFNALQQAARQVGSRQIQNRGTLVGNVCNASPAADGIPCLLSLNAEVELTSCRGVHVLPLEKFVLGNRLVAKESDEMVTALLIPKPANAAFSTFYKLAARDYLTISTVMVSACLERGPHNEITKARIAVGSCSPVALRLKQLESELTGQPQGISLDQKVQKRHLAELCPISDLRASASYREEAALVLVRRCLAVLSMTTTSEVKKESKEQAFVLEEENA